MAAARLASARSGPQRMSPVFRRRLARVLDSAPREPRLTRRAALVAGLGVAAGALAGGIVGKALAPSAAPVPHSPSSTVVPKHGRWTDVASCFVAGRLRPLCPRYARTCPASSGGKEAQAFLSVHATRCRSPLTANPAALRTRCRRSARSRFVLRRPGGSRFWAPRCQFASTGSASLRSTAACSFSKRPRLQVVRAWTGRWARCCGGTSNAPASLPTIVSKAGGSIESWTTSSRCKLNC